MFFQKASDPVEEATVAEVLAGATADPLQDHPEVAHLHRRGLTVVRHAQVPERSGRAAAEATAGVPLVHHDRVQRGQAAQCGKNRTRWAVQGPAPLSPRKT